MLDIIGLHGTTKGQDIYNVVMNAIQEFHIPLENISAICTVGAPAMIGKKIDLHGFCLQNKMNISFFHCAIHQQNLACYRQLKKTKH